MLSSGSGVEVVSRIVAPSGAVLLPGDAAMVIGVACSEDPVTYLCETTSPEFEAEEFFAFDCEIELLREVI